MPVAPRIPGQGGPTSPYTYDTRDANGKSIGASFPFDATTHALLDGATAHRDAGCLYTQVVVGLPDSSTQVINLSGFTGTRTFSAAQLAAVGLTKLEDITGLQITAK